MPVMRGDSIKSVVGNTTTSAAPPLFRMSKTCARPPPPTVTAMPVLALNWVASALRPGVVEAGPRTVRPAALSGADSQHVSKKARPALDFLGINFQHIDNVFLVGRQQRLHGAALGNHRCVIVQRHPTLEIFLDQEFLHGGQIHAASIR